MGNIVFSTIVENIKSYFGKEEELLQRPKGLPDAASEIYERPHSDVPPRPIPAKIIERPLPKDEPAKLPFSPDELRAALHAPPKPPPKEEPIEVDITREIDAFEYALKAHQPEPTKATRVPEAPDIPSRELSIPHQHSESGFFDEFGQFTMREGLDAEGLLEGDILHRMKEFHTHLKEGKEYYLYSSDVQKAVERKLAELRTLEQEWFHTQRQLDELQRGMTSIEAEIESRSQELRGLIMQAKAKSKLEQKVPPGQEFLLPDGRKLASLLDLRVAIRTMPDEVFKHHVAPWKNDFGTWVRGTLNDDQLARQIEAIRDKHSLEIFLARSG